MRRHVVLIGILLAMTTPAAAAQGASLDVTLDQTRIATTLGRVHTVESQITNQSGARTGSLVAHLNVASLDGTYVDLEDWSADVTRPVGPIAAGGNASLSWDFQTVNAGSFNVYVVLLPDKGPLVASQSVRVEVAEQRTLNAGGALPIAIAIPLLLGVAAIAVRHRVRRRTQ